MDGNNDKGHIIMIKRSLSHNAPYYTDRTIKVKTILSKCMFLSTYKSSIHISDSFLFNMMIFQYDVQCKY